MAVEERLQLVTFQLGQERYGINIMDVKEIYGYEDVRSVPNSPNYIEGIFSLRGNIVPIINLHKRFDISRANLSEEDKLLSGFIIINLENKNLGIIIDKVLRVIPVEKDSIQPPPQMITGIGSEYITGVVHEEEGYLIILDIQRLFNPEELHQIGSIA